MTGSVLLVGGSSEIGMAVLMQLLGPAPHQVTLAGRLSAELWRNAEKLRDAGYPVSTTEYDATLDTALDAGALDKLLDDACADHPLELAIVAVGSMSATSFAEGLTVNGTAVASLLHALLRRKPAQIVLLSSAAAVRPRASIAAYSLGKQLADSTGLLLGRQTGVRVLVVRPGFVTTRMTAGLPKPPLASTPEQVGRRVAAAVEAQKTVVWVPGVMGFAVRVLGLVPRKLLPAGWR
ncbi:SDR family NAD(P)-dependent oxidoreductase [Kribbella jejuensis]|uniref:Decaprenylphospho-beta-D-erythro-pentofuranosid-2-ulose 2-reductase n=1 Tax=Kribbella jejuensis TaxID=236068 RepID=A0A542EA53_9ACTN|nr:SDR family NAD(P)-dependent oxidoreductase [Kribbella jejuensis]TQJ12146.1 decaprenylphospho-beta-D-erythro-pentofuranosid-2-ulose 2-reductase [Kribbella jejuensis]